MFKMQCACGSNCCCQPSVARRGAISILLGLGFGVLCAYLASRSDPTIFDLKAPIFWIIVSNRFLIGFTIFFAGWMTKHPIFGFRTPAWLRGFCIGAVVSVGLALGTLLTPTPETAKFFWLTVLSGAIYGLIIDTLASRYGGEGKDLFV